MSRPEFENQTQISAITNKSIKWFEKVSTVALTANVFERHTFFSAPNSVSRIINLKMEFAGVPQGTWTGTREMILDNYMNASKGLGVFRGVASNVTDIFYFDQGAFTRGATRTTANITKYPDDYGAINDNVRALRYDETIGVSFVFLHTLNTGSGDATITEARSLICFIEEEVVKR